MGPGWRRRWRSTAARPPKAPSQGALVARERLEDRRECEQQPERNQNPGDEEDRPEGEDPVPPPKAEHQERAEVGDRSEDRFAGERPDAVVPLQPVTDCRVERAAGAAG